MNRGFNYYFREGVKSSASALYRNKGLIKSVVFLITELLGRVTLIFAALFSLAAVRQGEQVRCQGRLDVSQSFKDSGKPFSVWTYFLTVCVEGLMFLAGLVLIAALTFMLMCLGYGVGLLTDGHGETVTLIFAVPGAIVALVYVIAAALIFSPTAYIVANNPDLGVAGTLTVCFNTMKANGKFTRFLNVFIPALILLVYLALAGVAGYFLGDALGEEKFGTIVLVLWYGIAAIGFFFVAPIFILASRSASNHLFADIVADAVAADKNTNGVNILECRGRKFGADMLEKNLVSLFDEADANSYAVLDEINGKQKQAGAEQFLPEPSVQLGEAFESKRRKKRHKDEEQEEPLPTVTDVLGAEDKPGESEVKIPAAEERETAGVEPSVEQIIRESEIRNEQSEVQSEVQPETQPEVQTVEEAKAEEVKEEVNPEQPAAPVEDDGLDDELEEAAEQTPETQENKGE